MNRRCAARAARPQSRTLVPSIGALLTGMNRRRIAWRGVEWRGVAWRGVEWRGVAWRGVEWRGLGCVHNQASIGALFVEVNRHSARSVLTITQPPSKSAL